MGSNQTNSAINHAYMGGCMISSNTNSTFFCKTVASLNSIFFRFKPAKYMHKDFIFYLSRQSYHHNAVLTSLIKCFLLLESSNYIFFSWLHDLPFFVLVFYSLALDLVLYMISPPLFGWRRPFHEVFIMKYIQHI